jgi:hypothetical protein
LLSAESLRAQPRVLGAGECVRCHKHGIQAESWQRREPATLGDKAHFNTLEKLRGPRAAELAQKAGLDGPRNARCIACHATTVQGRARSGVSCESCHGPGSDYLEPHQKPNAYEASLQVGLRDLRVKPDSIVKLCVSCHVLSDPELRAAGHPAGERFDVGVSLRKIEHWSWDVRQTRLDYAQLSRLGQPLVAKLAAPTSAPAPEKPQPKPRPAAPVAAFDPDAAVALPDDYVEPISARRAAPVPDRPVAAALVTRPGGQARLAAPAPAPPESAKPVEPGAPATLADVAKARQAALDLLRALRAAGIAVPSLPAAAEYAGPDGELLRIQDEVMALLQKAAAKR